MYKPNPRVLFAAAISHCICFVTLLSIKQSGYVSLHARFAVFYPPLMSFVRSSHAPPSPLCHRALLLCWSFAVSHSDFISFYSAHSITLPHVLFLISLHPLFPLPLPLPFTTAHFTTPLRTYSHSFIHFISCLALTCCSLFEPDVSVFFFHFTSLHLLFT